MVSTYSTRNGIEKPSLNMYKNTWGDQMNENFDILDRALDGSVTKSASATLSSTDGADNEHISRIIIHTGTVGVGTITLGGVEKWYIVRNTGTKRCVVTNGGTTVTVPPGVSAVVYTDGTDCYFISGKRMWSLLQTQATTSGTSITFGGSTVDLEHYDELLLRVEGVSHASGSPSDFRIGVDTSPGSWFTFGSFGASATLYGSIRIVGHVYESVSGSGPFGGMISGAVADLAAAGVGATGIGNIPFRMSSIGMDITLDFGGATFDAGSIKLYGR